MFCLKYFILFMSIINLFIFDKYPGDPAIPLSINSGSSYLKSIPILSPYIPTLTFFLNI